MSNYFPLGLRKEILTLELNGQRAPQPLTSLVCYGTSIVPVSKGVAQSNTQHGPRITHHNVMPI